MVKGGSLPSSLDRGKKDLLQNVSPKKSPAARVTKIDENSNSGRCREPRNGAMKSNDQQKSATADSHVKSKVGVCILIFFS